ncbi:hypothetical protein DTW90_26560 [Neorhizobium sp. P12A]|uniref:hypothetical protein n=1 Tax=Neorhizobium sp. P12A TaxID=2268027 RepID=UPI0011F0239C|nr:hypothetical protein [Neorhizobium sp. P12A]KAA0693383.1 hypothetical protein DTW90_26560 [Neorhizobium sp. P12A]
MLDTEHPNTSETVKTLTRAQREAIAAIAFFRRQRKAGRGWIVGDKRLSERVIERLEQMQLVEESFLKGEPRLQLTIVGQAIEAKLQ